MVSGYFSEVLKNSLQLGLGGFVLGFESEWKSIFFLESVS